MLIPTVAILSSQIWQNSQAFGIEFSGELSPVSEFMVTVVSPEGVQKIMLWPSVISVAKDWMNGINNWHTNTSVNTNSENGLVFVWRWIGEGFKRVCFQFKHEKDLRNLL